MIKFAWCLDACIRENNIDLKRSRELQAFLESIRKNHEQVIGGKLFFCKWI